MLAARIEWTFYGKNDTSFFLLLELEASYGWDTSRESWFFETPSQTRVTSSLSMETLMTTKHFEVAIMNLSQK